MKGTLFILFSVCIAVSHGRSVSADVKGLRKLMKKGETGFFATCKLVLFSEKVDFDSAVEKCKNFHIGMGKNSQGNLATVDDNEKNELIRELLEMAYPGDKEKWGDEQWVWAGLRKIKNNVGRKKDKTYKPADWAWDNGKSPANFNSWMKKQPDQALKKKGNGGCNEKKCYQNQMRINHKGQWDDTYKFKTHPYACDYSGKYIVSAIEVRWPAAKEMCEAAGLVMAKVRNADETAEIVGAAEYFLGPRVAGTKIWDHENWFWIGANDMELEGTWKWADGEAFDAMAAWVNWRKPNPDNAEYIGDVGQDAMAISKWGEWDDSFGHKRRRPFACMCPDHA